jgi:hypothetical protein
VCLIISWSLARLVGGLTKTLRWWIDLA